jgi:rod shape-determining protein MreC
MEQVGLQKWLMTIFLLIIFSFMINRVFFFSPGAAEVTTSYILYPFLQVQKSITDPIVAWYQKKNDIAQLQKDCQLLRQKNEDLQSEMIAMESTLYFALASQEVREYKEKYTYESAKLVQVLMRSFDHVGHFFWINAGARDGVTCNMIALYKNNIVGRVIHVDRFYSKIALITDKRCKIAAMCLQTKVVGIYEGHNNFEPTLEFIPHYESLQLEDTVLATGDGLLYPQGFIIGKVASFQIHDVAYKIFVQPLIDLQQIEYVYLVGGV